MRRTRRYGINLVVNLYSHSPYFPRLLDGLIHQSHIPLTRTTLTARAPYGSFPCGNPSVVTRIALTDGYIVPNHGYIVPLFFEEFRLTIWPGKRFAVHCRE